MPHPGGAVGGSGGAKEVLADTARHHAARRRDSKEGGQGLFQEASVLRDEIQVDMGVRRRVHDGNVSFVGRDGCEVGWADG